MTRGVAVAAAATAEPALEAHQVAATAGRRVLWSGLELAVAPGSFVAVLGPNGAGKTTLIRLVLGQQPPSAGRLTVLGRPPGHSRAQIGYLPQRRSFSAGLPVRGRDIVRLGLDGHRWGTPVPDLVGRSGRARRERVAEVLELVGATGYADRPVGAVSGGEQQRLLIAQALVRHPRLLVLDEPLDGLDLPNQAAVAALVDDIRRREGVTVLMVAHDVNPILPYLDAVVYLARGGGVAGPPEEVISSATLSRLYDTPVEVLTTAAGGLVVVGTPEAPGHHRDPHTGRSRR